jgi:hypothetical protein
MVSPIGRRGGGKNAHMAYRNRLADDMGRLWGEEGLGAGHGEDLGEARGEEKEGKRVGEDWLGRGKKSQSIDGASTCACAPPRAVPSLSVAPPGDRGLEHLPLKAISRLFSAPVLRSTTRTFGGACGSAPSVGATPVVARSWQLLDHSFAQHAVQLQ